MLALATSSHLPEVIPFPSLRQQHLSDDDVPFAPDEKITLRAWYERCLLPDIMLDQAARSIKADRCALNRWEETTSNPDIRRAGKHDLQMFLSRLQAKGNAPATINAYWRELKAIFADAVDWGVLDRVPRLRKGRKARLLREPPKRQRELITEEEVTRLWRNCSAASYPARTQFPAPKLCRVQLVLFWVYGPRTLDVFNLRRSDVLIRDRLLRFEAMKTSKLQGLPLTDLVIAHLKSIWGHSERLFPGFTTPGRFNPRTGKWKRGYYTTWRNEIGGDRFAPPITYKHFREAMVTRYNALYPTQKLGSWIAAHYIPGVSAQNYDLPTAPIREAIESAPVPQCFYEID